jgi:hypothetical protein
MEQWYALEAIAKSIHLSVETDSLIWQYDSSGVYSASSLYAIINFRGITPIFIPAVWKIVVPPRIHVFLWLIMHNKIMTRDNMKKRKLNKPEDCVFCSEPESVQHLFFDCFVARNVWQEVSCFFGKQIGSSIGNIAQFWVADKKHAAFNSICAAVLWSIWKLRNDLIFNGVTWLSFKQIWWIILRTIRKWEILFKESMMDLVGRFYHHFHCLARKTPEIEGCLTPSLG